MIKHDGVIATSDQEACKQKTIIITSVKSSDVKIKRKSQTTVWNIQDFSVTQILREINFELKFSKMKIHIL